MAKKHKDSGGKMNHSEIRALFEKKISDALDLIKNAKNGDLLSISTSVSYIDDKLTEKQSYNGYDNTSIVATATVYVKGEDTDEDPSYVISLLADIKNGVAKNPAELANELQSFDTELARFLSELSSSENVSELIRREDERINEEGAKMAAKLEESLAKMKKAGIIGVIVIFAVLLLFTLLK